MRQGRQQLFSPGVWFAGRAGSKRSSPQREQQFWRTAGSSPRQTLQMGAGEIAGRYEPQRAQPAGSNAQLRTSAQGAEGSRNFL